MMKQVFASFIFILPFLFSYAQTKRSNLIYVDKQGVMRYAKGNAEAAFFGTNYTVPFAYGYRSHKALGVDIEKAIDADVYHMSRLGLDAFRVHVWDVEISDSLGNLLANEHLRLFDYLIQKLKQRHIRILITPIAFWGNGYPEPDIKTNGFSYVYTKGGSVVQEEAFKAQENYLRQFFTHINPYTKLSYKDDPDVVAMEINNEPHHSGPKERTTEYVNRMAAAVRSTGWTKPIFYNISESPSYAGAVVKANVDGHSFQWYPTGLVAGHEQKGNLLPNVDAYRIPFLDTIPALKTRARMVYEFDAGDVMQPVMYPAMARSFRTAGFQWATQFAYDPMHTAYANTEYQTHYLNLVYTPAKAISLLIASKAFHRLPRGKSFGAYPADTLFDVFRVSYREQLSEMNSEEEFYYTGNTSTQPKNIAKLKHIAGVGSSPVVEYKGSGAYFLDQMEDGIWRLELMPDVVRQDDPFKKASPKKAVTGLAWQKREIDVYLPDLGKNYEVIGLNEGHTVRTSNQIAGLHLAPGAYLLVGLKTPLPSKEQLRSNYPAEFHAMPPSVKEPTLQHRAMEEASPNQPFTIIAEVAGTDAGVNLSLALRNSSNKWKTVTMQRTNGKEYKAEVPAGMVTPGVVNYRIMLKKADGETFTFPGGFKGDPYAWDNYHNETYQTFVAAPASPLELFKPTTGRDELMQYNPDWRNNTIEYTGGEKPMQLVLKATMNQPAKDGFMGWQYFFGDKIAGRKSEMASFSTLVIRARSAQGARAKFSLISREANAYSATIQLKGDWQEIAVPLESLRPDSFLLLPRPYPGFQPLTFQPASNRPLNIADIEKVECTFGEGATAPVGIEVESVWLKGKGN